MSEREIRDRLYTHGAPQPRSLVVQVTPDGVRHRAWRFEDGSLRVFCSIAAGHGPVRVVKGKVNCPHCVDNARLHGTVVDFAKISSDLHVLTEYRDGQSAPLVDPASTPIASSSSRGDDVGSNAGIVHKDGEQLHGEYLVVRRDGRDSPGEKHDGCQHFVLDLTHDPAATVAVLAYASEVEATQPEFAQELRDWVATVRPADP